MSVIITASQFDESVSHQSTGLVLSRPAVGQSPEVDSTSTHLFSSNSAGSEMEAQQTLKH